MTKFENIRVYNFQNAVRALHNQDNSWNNMDSEFGLCKDTDIQKEIYKKLMKYKAPTDDSALTSEYHNVVLWNYGDYIEYCIIGPKDMELAKKSDDFLTNIAVGYDVNIDGKISTVLITYNDIYDAYYNRPSENLENMIKQLPYSYDLIINN